MTMIELTIAEADLAKILLPGIPCTFTRHTEASSGGVLFHVDLHDACVPPGVHHEGVHYVYTIGGPRLDFHRLDGGNLSVAILPPGEGLRRGW